MTNLPASWCEIEFDEGFDSLSPNTIKIKQKSYLSVGEIPVIDQGENFISGYTNDPDSLVQISSPLIGFGDHTRRFKFITFPFAVGADGLKLIKPINNLLDAKFAYYQLLNTKIEDRGYSRHYQYLRKSKFNLAPLNEQIRIADKIDELFSELDNGIEELETAQKKLELYRQSLLKSAVEGELSKEWRETQTEISETAEQLFVRILKERREIWEQEKLKEFADKGKNPPKDWQDKYPEPVQPDTENLPQLPEGWVWASLDQVMLIKGGIQKKPSRAPVNNKFPFLRVANVYRAQLNLDKIHEIELFEGEIDRFKLETGDLLIVEGNGSLTEIGRCAIWDGSIPNAVHQNHLIRARPIHVLSKYLETWLNSSDGINYMAKLAVTTSGLYSLSVGKIAQIPVPLPPLNEQAFITIDLAAKLEQQKQQLMNLEELQNLNKLQRKNILSDAFTGKLIPQYPNDELAQVLLGRIQQQREAEALVKKAPPKKRSTQKVKKEVAMSKNILDILKNQSDWISGQELAELFGINGSSDITDIENFYHELKTLTLEEKISVKPDNDLFKTQDLFKYLG